MASGSANNMLYSYLNNSNFCAILKTLKNQYKGVYDTYISYNGSLNNSTREVNMASKKKLTAVTEHLNSLVDSISQDRQDREDVLVQQVLWLKWEELPEVVKDYYISTLRQNSIYVIPKPTTSVKLLSNLLRELLEAKTSVDSIMLELWEAVTENSYDE